MSPFSWKSTKSESTAECMVQSLERMRDLDLDFLGLLEERSRVGFYLREWTDVLVVLLIYLVNIYIMDNIDGQVIASLQLGKLSKELGCHSKLGFV